MLTILVEIMMSVFIANFKASEHPYINIIARGFIIMVVGFCIGVFSCVLEGNEIPYIWGLKMSFIVGFIVSFLIYFIEIFFNYIDGKK
ncbi:hypothetical protein GCM10025882_23010 [Acinetobacter gyllenbergii]|uniref:Uncharacterized protein n=1 Tax=Acinetobacter gyllenbergii CIP 110306 = MTCC 11365 TaxID=1217657 RepID=A0A829HMY4_9GAMM|nr:hypothetical protein [Acinetobacter gyllenbergii]EPF93346.1 hypothetical protein F957_00142 [Acinetobacter gyllenbergii CIP 110306 = MTCC 11365]GMA11876.1 hypothetical protein GCM10025882_23010 [Acinetobacter gyllenbergii]